MILSQDNWAKAGNHPSKLVTPTQGKHLLKTEQAVFLNLGVGQDSNLHVFSTEDIFDP